MLKIYKTTWRLLIAFSVILIPTLAMAAENHGDKGGIKGFASQLQAAELLLLGVALVLFIVIIAMGNMVKRMAYHRYISDIRSGSKILLILVGTGWALMGFPVDLLAESVQNEGSSTPLANIHTTVTMMILLTVIAIEVIVIFILLRSLKMLMGGGLQSDKAIVAGATGSVWGALWAQLNRSVDVEKEEDILLDHDYDGIQELDNDLPPWWKWGFYITIVFSVIYLARFHVFQTAPLQIEEYEIAMARAEADMELRRAESPDISEETVVFLDSDSDLAEGKRIFTTNCSVCHGQLGEGGIGPNFTDDYWIHGGTIKDIFRTTKNGVIEKGMTPWRDILPPLQTAQVASYIKTLRATDPPNQKDPEGELYIPEEPEIEEDMLEEIEEEEEVVIPIETEE